MNAEVNQNQPGPGILRPGSVDELQDMVAGTPRILALGNGSKTALSAAEGYQPLSLQSMDSIVAYEPGEFMVTAQCGISLRRLSELLEQEGQHLPFDPPMSGHGATLGGTIAAGLSGSGRYRFGGIRDFILAVRFVDGTGTIHKGGERVVKNAAGFDFPKLMTGSMGRLAILTEATFKVFPRARSTVTVSFRFGSLEKALENMVQLTLSSLDLDALDLQPPDCLWIRLGGVPESLPQRLDVLRQRIGAEAQERLHEEADPDPWAELREFSCFPSTGGALVKVALTPKHIPDLDTFLESHEAIRRYSCGGQLGWIHWPDTIEPLSSELLRTRLPGLVLRGGSKGRPRIGHHSGSVFLDRLKKVLDPDGRFPTY